MLNIVLEIVIQRNGSLLGQVQVIPFCSFPLFGNNLHLYIYHFHSLGQLY